MTPEFKTQLVVRLVNDEDSGVWRLEAPLVYVGEWTGVLCIPVGFETDFASVPRFLFTYMLTGNTAHEAAVVHDYLYRTPDFPITREDADKTMREAMEVTGVPAWRRTLIYAGVRAGGASAFKERS